MKERKNQKPPTVKEDEGEEESRHEPNKPELNFIEKEWKKENNQHNKESYNMKGGWEKTINCIKINILF